MTWKTQYEKWISYKELDSNLKAELIKLKDSEIEEAFYTDLQFGTGGMRGEIGPGTNRMNIYTIRKANVGFAKYLVNKYGKDVNRGVVIAYDNRHFSSEFALESARVLGTFGIRAYLFDSLRPTPELSFAVRHLSAIGGIVVTASHNPPVYNGYKIYDEFGCQLVPKYADIVIKYVNEVTDVFSINVKDVEELRKAGLIVTIGEEIDNAYVERVKAIELNKDMDKSKVKIVFTPLHGTSNILAQRVLHECGYSNVFPVKAQCTIDPLFSTVKSPNPEDGSAFKLAIELGKEVNADILIATDPDADRVGLAVLNDEGEYVLLTGNQTGAILLNYILTTRKANKMLGNNGVVFNTIVTSDFGAKIAERYGLEVISTLTGFKFIGEKAKEIENTGKEFIFGYEESYGYLISDFVRDKDSIQSLLMCAEAAAYYKQMNKTLYNVLFDLYEEYGYYIESLVNINLKGITGQAKIKEIMASFRSNKPVVVANKEVVVTEDYQTLIRYEDGKETALKLPQSDVIKFVLEDDSWFVLRPSGTEPKLKIYVAVVSDSLLESETKNEQIKQYVLDRIALLN